MFADTDDLQKRWRTLVPDELAKAELILADVDRDLRREFPDLEARAAVDPDLLLEANRITCNIVRRRITGEELELVEQEADTMGPFARSRTFRQQPRATGAVELTPQERRILSPATVATGVPVALWSNE